MKSGLGLGFRFRVRVIYAALPITRMAGDQVSPPSVDLIRVTVRVTDRASLLKVRVGVRVRVRV